MENFIDQMFERVDIQQIIGFIIYGCASSEPSEKDCEKRLREADSSFYELIYEQCSNKEVQNNIEEKFSETAAVWQETYIEIGIKIAAKLILQLCDYKGKL